MSRRLILGLLAASTVALGAPGLRCEGLPRAFVVEETFVSVRGYQEPHTPGARSPDAQPPSEALVTLLGPDPDLNRVDFLRYRAAPARGRAPALRGEDSDSRAREGDSDSRFASGGRGPRPRAILILMPGFLGGASSFGPLARQLVRASHGRIEVWAIDRRPNRFEDRLGARHAAAGTPEAIAEGFQFYFAEHDAFPFGNFPGPEDVDIDADGVIDPLVELEDERGTVRGFVEIAQDDVRFAAHWGFDTLARDWMRLVRLARKRVGHRGLVIVGGHSLGTTLTAMFAAYDLDPGPGVDPVHRHVDGLLLLEGGGAGPGRETVNLSTGSIARPGDAAAYRAVVDSIATPGGPDVFLESSQGIVPRLLAVTAELAARAATALPQAPSFAQRTPLFRTFPLSLFFLVPATNRAAIGLFVDDDFQPVGAFRASVGFTDDGENFLQAPIPGLLPEEFYVALPVPGGLRGWKEFGDPTLPTCPPNVRDVSPGCAVEDRGPRPAPDDPPRTWGLEREVTDLDDVIDAQTAATNFIEGYFLDGRLSLDLAYGRDSSVLGDDSLLAVTQNATMDAPVLAIGGSNGLAPTEASFAGYLGSIATPAGAQRIEILEGYAHIDVTTAAHNEGVPVILDWISQLRPPRRGH